MKRILALSLAALMTLGVLTGCQSQTETDELVTVQLNEVTHSVFYAPMYAAIELGLFEEAGLSIELTNGNGADNVMVAVLTGESDIGLAGPESTIYVALEGSDKAPKVFAQLTSCDGSFLVSRIHDSAEDFEWTDLKDSIIIAGRPGGIPEMTLEYAMNLNGVIPNEEAYMDTAVEFAMMAGAFTGGYGDYVALFEPTATQVENEGYGTIVASIGESAGEVPYTAYFATSSYMEENADVVQAFTDVMTAALQWVNETDSATVAEAIAPQFPDTDLDILTTVVERYKSIGAWKSDMVLTEDALNRLENIMSEAGELTERPLFSDVVNNSFAEKAIG